MNEPNRPYKKESPKKKKPQRQWPLRILALLVVGFCLFVGIDTSHHLLDSLKLWDPLRLETYALVRDTMDDAYAQNLFSGRPTAEADDPGQEATHDPNAGPETQADSSKTLDEQIRDAFVDLNSLAVDKLGQRELNGVVKLDNGYITTYLNEPQDLSHQVSQTVALRQRVEENGGKFVFVMAPHLIDKYDPMLPPGIEDYYNQMADDFLGAMAEAGVPAMDLREMMQAEGYDHYGGFFRTDHHWTPYTALWAADRVMRELDAWDWVDTDGIDLTPDDFALVNEGVRFYGTAAERTGQAFAGEADTLYDLVPKEKTNLRYRPYGEADYGDTVDFEEVYRDWQHADYGKTYGPDAYYLYKTMYDANVWNENAPIQNDMVLLCDSFGVPFQSFAACYMAEVLAFQGREHPDLTSAIQRSDIVMVLYTPSSLDIRTENANIFNF